MTDNLDATGVLHLASGAAITVKAGESDTLKSAPLSLDVLRALLVAGTALPPDHVEPYANEGVYVAPPTRLLA